MLSEILSRLGCRLFRAPPKSPNPSTLQTCSPKRNRSYKLNSEPIELEEPYTNYIINTIADPEIPERSGETPRPEECFLSLSSWRQAQNPWCFQEPKLCVPFHWLEDDNEVFRRSCRVLSGWYDEGFWVEEGFWVLGFGFGISGQLCYFDTQLREKTKSSCHL